MQIGGHTIGDKIGKVSMETLMEAIDLLITWPLVFRHH